MSGKTVLILGSYAPSLVHFRGALIAAMVERGHKVFAAAPAISTEVAEQLKAMEPSRASSRSSVRASIRPRCCDLCGRSAGTNTVFFDPGGVARTQTPSGKSVPGTWAAANGQLCLTTGAAQECWPYSQPFQAGQQISLTSSCNSAFRWTALGTNQAAPVQQGAGERG